MGREHDVPLIGRERECALLSERYNTAASGRTRVVLLAGEPGIGKTRLLDEVAARVSEDGAMVLRGGALQAEGMPPYLPFLEALGQHIQTASPEQLREQAGPAAAVLTTIFPDLAVRLGELLPAYPLPAEQARLRLYEAVANFLAAIATSQPLVLMLDDLHWADPATLDLLWYVARRRPDARLLILGAYRDGELQQNPSLERVVMQLNRLRILTVVSLGPLSDVEIASLAQRYLDAPVDTRVSRLLYTQSEGNPFFAEELLLEWIESGVLSERGGVQDLASRLGNRLPSNVIGVIRQRLAHLSRDVVDQLRVAAVIGRMFDASLLATVIGREVETVDENLLQAHGAKLIGRVRDGAWTFCHEKIRESLYAEVSSARRRRLHEAIGRVLEVQTTATSAQELTNLAFHFAHSGDSARGAVYCERAAELALRAGALDEALRCFKIALDLLDDDDQHRGDLLLRIGETALVAGAEREAEATYESARSWWLKAGDPLRAARAAHGLGVAQFRLEQLSSAESSLEMARQLSEGDSELAVRVLVELATLIGVSLERVDEGIALGRQALDTAIAQGGGLLEAAASRTLGNLLVRGNDLSRGVPLLKRALEIAEAHDDLAEAAECCLYLGITYFWMAEFGRSHEITLKQIEYARRCQAPYYQRHVHSGLAAVYAHQGRWIEAERTIARAQAPVESLTGAEPTAFLRFVQGFLAYQHNDYAAAVVLLEESAAMFPTTGPGTRHPYLGPLCVVQLALGKRDEAQASMTEMERYVADIPSDYMAIATVLSYLALLAVTMGDRERAIRYYPRLEAFRGQCHWLLVDRVLGAIKRFEGDWTAAEQLLTSAETTARRENMRPELARTLVERADLELARGGPGSSARARDLLGQALGIFRELEMPPDVNRIRDRLRSLPPQPGAIGHAPLPAGLTERELSVLRLVARGLRNRQIADALFLSEKTVANSLSSIYRKTGSENRAGATSFALRHSLA